MLRPTAAEMATALALKPHPEGGYYRETFRSAAQVESAGGLRPAVTAILFMVTAGSPSLLHRLRSDELWLAQGGAPLELLTITRDGALERRLLGIPGSGACDDCVIAGEPAAPAPQLLVPAETWQAARVAEVGAARRGERHRGDDRWSLVACIVTPGFSFADYELGVRSELLSSYPQHADLIVGFVGEEPVRPNSMW